MDIKISGKHIDLTEAIEQYAEKKVSKLTRYFNRVLEIRVLIEKRKVGFNAEIIVDVEHHDDFVATADHDDLYAAIDLATDRMTRQLHDHKSRLRDDKHSTPTREAAP